MFAAANDLGSVYAAETGFLLSRSPDTVRAPDVTFVRKARVATTSAEGYSPGAPDLAVEVLSRGDTASEVPAKVQEWLDAGTLVVWVADPRRATITSYSSSKPPRTIPAGQSLDCGDLMPGLSISVAELFA